MNQENSDKIGKIIMDFQSNCTSQFLNVKEVYWERGSEDGEVVLEVHVVIEESKGSLANSNTYCYPIANFARERGLYLWDTVTNWDDETVTLRFRFED